MKHLFVILLVIGSFGAAAQEARLRQGVASIDGRGVEAQVRFLSSDDLKGRKAGGEYAHITARYIESQLFAMGYDVIRQPFSDSLCNILVRVAGQDTTRSVVVGAHYDHLGVVDGAIHNGADDNASGVSAVLEIAKAFKVAGLTPRHNVIFALWDSEESGSQGSRHFVRQAEDSLYITYYMNFDMIGRNTDESRPELFRYLYTDSAPECERWIRQSIATYDLQLDADCIAWDKPTTGSDNAPFARYGIPIVWYHTDGHPDYHKASDTADKINWQKLVDIIRSAYIVTWNMATKQ